MILEGADISFIESDYPVMADMLSDMNLPITLDMIDIMGYLGLNTSERADSDTQGKIKAIYEYAVTQGNPLEVITAINCKIGYTDQSTVDRLYQYTRLNSEIDRTASNLGNLLKQKDTYENSNNT